MIKLDMHVLAKFHTGRFRLALAIAVVAVLSVSAAMADNAECQMCHSDKSLTTSTGKSVYVRESVLKATSHGQFGCSDCHAGLDASKIPHAAKIEPVGCMDCHSDAKDVHTTHKGHVPTEGSSAQMSNSCKECHGSHMSKPLSTACSACHPDAKDSFASDGHGKALLSGSALAPDCFSCHKSSIVNPGKGGEAQLKLAQQKVCFSCHVNNPAISSRTGSKAHFIKGVENSAHGLALAKGNGAAANCVDCHGSHDVFKGSDAKASVNRANITTTCGKCHPEIAKQFDQSIHGKAVKRGSADAPVCTTCHGEHNILKATDPKSPIAPRNVAEQVCGTCHSSLKLSEKYGISSDRFQTFSDSFHGLAIRGGAVNVANCASCHTAHDIKPSSDPTSSISRKNIPKTCGECHPGANERFAVGKVHVAMTQTQQPVLWWIKLIYALLIIGVIGGMFGHNLLDFWRKLLKHLKKHDLHGLYTRMTLFERLQHFLMGSSFIVLAITGFMLHYPDAWWVVYIRKLSSNIFELRGLLHRIAAVGMVAACLIHVLYVALTARGRQFIVDMFPKFKDVADVIGVLKYDFGMAKEKPKLARFSYVEKAEYWALIWGSVIMTLTGIVMWANNFFMNLITKLGWDISRTIHFYEAWLAVLAIIVWHFYFVIFNPDVYPMNAAWWTGTVTKEVLEKEHGLEYDTIKDKIEARKPSADQTKSK